LHVQGQNRDQATLLPEQLDDLIGDDNAVRLIDAFVDSLDLKALGFARIVTVCRSQSSLGGDMIAIDASKFTADNAPSRVLRRKDLAKEQVKLDTRIAGWL